MGLPSALYTDRDALLDELRRQDTSFVWDGVFKTAQAEAGQQLAPAQQRAEMVAVLTGVKINAAASAAV